VPVLQNWPLVTWPSTSSRPTTWTAAALAGFALSATLNRTLDCSPAGKSNRAMPVRVVTARVTPIGSEGSSSTW